MNQVSIPRVLTSESVIYTLSFSSSSTYSALICSNIDWCSEVKTMSINRFIILHVNFQQFDWSCGQAQFLMSHSNVSWHMQAIKTGLFNLQRVTEEYVEYYITHV